MGHEGILTRERHPTGRAAAAKGVAGRTRRTPLLPPSVTDAIWVKFEFLQHCGVFKTRGAFVPVPIPARNATAVRHESPPSMRWDTKTDTCIRRTLATPDPIRAERLSVPRGGRARHAGNEVKEARHPIARPRADRRRHGPGRYSRRRSTLALRGLPRTAVPEPTGGVTTRHSSTSPAGIQSSRRTRRLHTRRERRR